MRPPINWNTRTVTDRPSDLQRGHALRAASSGDRTQRPPVPLSGYGEFQID